ncbi:MAG: LPS assembly lipoprotein LptE [Myxococcota bacterium]
MRLPGILALLVLSLPSCFAGYQWVHYEGALGDIQTIAIESLRNESLEPGVDSIMSDAIATEFRRRGALRVVEDKNLADLVVDGEVKSVRINARSFSSIQFSLEYAVTVSVDVAIRRRDGTEVELGERSLSETELYFASADVEIVRKNREEAVRRVAVILAGRIHDALFVRTIQ